MFFSQPLHDYVAENNDHPERIVVAIKAIGNAGHVGSLKTLQKVLIGSSAEHAHLYVKIHAVTSLKNIAKKEPKSVSTQ